MFQLILVIYLSIFSWLLILIIHDVLYYDNTEFPDEDDEDYINDDVDYNSDLGEAMHLVDGQHHHPLLGTLNNTLLENVHNSDKSEKTDGTSQSLYGLVYTRKQLLLEAFEKVDAEGQGLVTVEQWADVMKQVREEWGRSGTVDVCIDDLVLLYSTVLCPDLGSKQ